MATVRIHFPENETPTLVNLHGNRITVGRLPHNTIQIIDRTISALHAEFIREGEHYRLHDRGSSNGTCVNGDPIADYHLKDACRISFGAFECEFSPALAPAGLEDANGALPSRGEINEVRSENVELRNQVELLREEVETLSKIQPAEAGSAAEVVFKEEFIRIVGEMEKVKESLFHSGAEVKRLKGDLSILQRDRSNLQRGLDDVKAELLKKLFPPRVAPGASTAILNGSESHPIPEESKGEEEVVESRPLPEPEPATPPFKALPKPFVPPGMSPVPVRAQEPSAPPPTVAKPQVFAPAASAKAQPGSGSGIRPFAKGNPPAPQSKPGLSSDRPMTSGAQPTLKPLHPLTTKPFPKSIGKVPVATPAGGGPKGTQKISVAPPAQD
jgi:pSer/pThr/pTyr-binding forkhead associated (FHA) protein